MQLSINREEQYTSIAILSAHIQEQTCNDLQSAVTAELSSGLRNIILGCNTVREADPCFRETLSFILSAIGKEEGSLVAYEVQADTLKAIFDAEGVVITRVYDEAADYIFMEELSRELGSMDEEEDQAGISPDDDDVPNS